MSEWRCRFSTRANREHCTPITTEQRKNQRFRLMKGVRSVYGTRSCVHEHARDRQHRCNEQQRCVLIAKKTRPARNTDVTRLSCDSNSRVNRAIENYNSTTDRQSTRRKCRLKRVNHAVKKNLAEQLQKVLRATESDANRANRPK